MSEHRSIRTLIRWLVDPWSLLALLGMAIHGGTALLRLNTFWPYPKLIDFGAFYASAMAMRLGMSPYALPADFLASLQQSAGLGFRPPATFNPPLWPFLLQPLTWLPFPSAAWIWLLLQLTILLGCSLALAGLANLHGANRYAVAGIVITFGPVFLDLTLGQTSILLLATALLIGRGMASRRKRDALLAPLAQALAGGIKLYPTFWIGAFVLRKRWRILALSLILTGATIVGMGLLKPADSQTYWLLQLPHRVSTAADQVNTDDQAITSWLERIFRPQKFSIPGLSVAERFKVQWTPPWSIDRKVPRIAGYLILGLLSIAATFWVWRADPGQDEPAFYLWMLLGLLAFPHMERYNHALLLPAMAWLWGQGERGRRTAVTGYFLAGLARLTHLWVLILPWPWAPLATGFGVLAVLSLLAGMAWTIRAR